MRDCEFLHSQALSDRIRDICREREVDCAVAFLSDAVRKNAFPRWKGRKLRIVCDIAMGCNDQSTLRAYGAPGNPDLRVCDGLHAKIYISAAGAVIGSANLSLNGIGLTDQAARNIEAGVYFAPDTAGWNEAKHLFEQLWQSPVIDAQQLERAPQQACDPGRRIGAVGPQDPSALERIKAYPDRFASALFIAEHDRIAQTLHDEQRDRYNAAERAGSFEPGNRSLILCAEHDEYPPIPANALMFWHGGEGTRVQLLGYTNVVPVRAGKYTSLWGVKRWDRFWTVQGMSVPERLLSEADERFVTSLHGGSWVLSASDLSRALLNRD